MEFEGIVDVILHRCFVKYRDFQVKYGDFQVK
jgi:hypothetical protein